jgi:hypothetical protein
MISWEQLQESGFVQFVLEKGEEKGRAKTFIEVIRELAAKRFPGLALGQELDSIQDVEALHKLCLQVDEFADAASLQRRVRELAKLN